MQASQGQSHGINSGSTRRSGRLDQEALEREKESVRAVEVAKAQAIAELSAGRGDAQVGAPCRPA